MLRKLAVIPSRGGSKRIPGKNIKDLCGIPLIHYSIEHAVESACFDRVIVTTDCPRIAKVAEAGGAEIPFLRPPELAGDDVGSYEVLNHIVETIWTDLEDYLICVLQPTSPIRDTQKIIEMTELMDRKSDFSSVVSVCEVPHQYSIVSQFAMDDEGIIERFEQAQILRSQDKPRRFARNGPSVIVTRKSTVVGGSIYGKTSCGVLMEGKYNLDIDTQSDFKLVEAVIRGQIVDDG